MTAVDRATATAFAIAVNRIRPDWDVHGIRAAFEKLPNKATLSEALTAAIRLASNGQIRTPALLADLSGEWWGAATTQNTRPDWVTNRNACAVHPSEPRDTCQPCAAERGTELTPEQRADAAAECRRIAAEAMTAAREKQAAIDTARQEAQA